MLPQILPRLIDSVRLELGPAWLFLIAAEAIAADSGLGYRIFLVRRYLSMDVILPYVAWITLLAFLMDLGLRASSAQGLPLVRAGEGGMSAIVFDKVWKEYGDHIVLEQIDLEIEPRAFLVLVGASGCGKTTFLRMLLGEEQPTRGAILLENKPLKPEPDPDRGVVFQRYSVFPHLTALDNVMHRPRVRNVRLPRPPVRRRSAAPRARRRVSCSRQSGSPATRTNIRPRSPAACSSASLSPRR